MRQIRIEEHGHRWEKENLVTQSDSKGCFDKYKCKHCGLTGKSYTLGVIQLKETYSKEKIFQCGWPNVSAFKVPEKIRIVNFIGYGRIFGNIVNGSEHDVVASPKGYKNDNSGVWVMGIGEPVRILTREYQVIK